MPMPRRSPALCLGFVIALASQGGAAEPEVAAIHAARDKGIAFLKTTQAEDGTWSSSQATGVTALVAYSLLTAGVPADDPVLAKTLTLLEKLAQQDGRICRTDSRIPAYETAIGVMTLQAANASGKYTEILENAEKFLRSVQAGADGSFDQTDPSFGGAGYAPGGGRPDLSNTAFFLDALQASGVKSDDPAVKNALVFISRCQNLESEYNTTASAAEVNDGGFYYTVAAGGGSPVGHDAEGGLRSYGSMTYAGFKSMLYAGVGPDDVRVKAAREWIQKHFTVTENPGMGANGQFYYYYLFAKALAASKLDVVEDTQGVQHNWRNELAAQLLKSQQANGSWVNSASNRWFEGDPHLVTAYVLVALQACTPPQ
jgi:squalene-hopene/tetraprenyl-beta-curcumene cyclase